MNWASQLPILQVVIPLLAAPICVALRNKSIAWLFATLVTWATFAVSIMLAIEVRTVGELSYEIGGWAPPWGIEYRVDALASLVLLVVSGIGAIVMPFFAA